jgi:membrane fusion protein, heavy metal efflux system
MRSFFCTVALGLCLASPALAHEGHDDAPGSEPAPGGTQGPIEVSELAQRNLGLAVEEAELRPLETTLRVIGEIMADPERSGTVSSRISGRVSAVFAQEGQRVEKGRPLVEVESLQLGDPPPRVRYASPVSGVVTDRHVVVGDDVEPSRHLLEVADLSAVLAIGRVFEGQIGQVSVGQKVRVRVPSYPKQVFEGVIERLGGKLDAESRSLAVYARVANPDELLRPGMRATLSLVTGGSELALVIPKSAVLGEAGNLYAFVRDEDRPERFERRPLVLGVSNDRFVEVIEGLSPGEPVVTEGNYSLQYLRPISEEKKQQSGTDAEGVGEAGGNSHRSSPGAVVWVFAALGLLGLAGLGLRMLRGRPRGDAEAR